MLQGKKGISLSFIRKISTHERYVCFISYLTNLLDKEKFYSRIQFIGLFIS